MKRHALLIFSFAILSQAALWGQNLDNTMDSVSYSIGVLIAQSLKQQGLDSVKTDAFAKGVKDALAGDQMDISVEEANQIVQTHMQEKAAKQYEDLIQKGKSFLADNAKRDEVKVTDSGLQYEVLRTGEGASPSDSSKVTVHYRGELLNGQVFDSSYKRGEPVTFGVTQVIPGWTEGLQMMKKGGKWKLYIPYDLGYGERGAGQAIGPFETLIFEVELLEVQ